MEWVLHRSNTLERVDRGLGAGADRLELDLWHKRGRFSIAHDPSLGRMVIGPNGVGVPSERPGWARPVQVARRLLTLPELLAARRPLPPLLLDLKGRWPRPMLASLREWLRSRSGDAVCGTRPQTLARYRDVDPDALLVYSPRQLDPDARSGDRHPTAVSTKASVLLGHPELAERWRIQGLGVYVWEVPDRRTLDAVLRHDLAGVIVSEPAWIAELRSP